MVDDTCVDYCTFCKIQERVFTDLIFPLFRLSFQLVDLSMIFCKGNLLFEIEIE